MSREALVLAAVLSALLPDLARGQPTDPSAPRAPEGYERPGTEQGEADDEGEPLIGPALPAEQPSAEPEPQEAEPGRREGRGIEYGAHLLVPFWGTRMLPGVRLRPGVGVRGRLGWEFARGFATELQLGYIRNKLDIEEDRTVSNLWVAAGVRYPFLNPTAFVPFVGASVQIGFWNACEERPAMGGVFCENREPAVGFDGTVGVIFELSKKAALEGGITTVVSLEGAAFHQAQLYLMPFAGLALYY